MQEFRKLLKEKLAEKGMSINKLAKEIGVRELFIREITSGRKISRPLVLKIADYFQDPNILHIYTREFQERKSKKSKKEVQTMTKFDLVQATQKQFGITLSEANEIVDYVCETVIRVIISGERVAIPSLGVFGVKEKRARKGRNPRTGEEITIPAKKVVVFKPAKSLQIAVNKK